MVYAVCTPDGLDSCLQDMRFCIIAKQGMRHDGVDIFAACGLQQSGRLAQGSAGAGHVVYDDYGFIEKFVIRQGHFNLFVPPSFLMGDAIVEANFIGYIRDPLL